MLPEGFSRRDALLVLDAMSRIGSLSTAEGAAGRVASPEVLDAMRRMERPEDFWDLVFSYSNDRILRMERQPHGEVRFEMVDVQAHDVRVFLHQNREERERFDVLERDEDMLTRVFMEGLEETRSRSVFY